MQNLFILPILSLSCLPSYCSSTKTVLFNFSGANLNFPLCASPPQPTRYLLLHFQQNLSDTLNKPNAVGRMTSHPAPAHISCMCHSLLPYTANTVYQVPSQCGDGVSCQAEDKEKGEWKNRITRSSGRQRELLSAEGTGREQNTRDCRRTWVLLSKEENRQEGKTITGIFFLLNTCNERGKTAKAEDRTTLPKGQNRGSFWLTFQMLLLHHRDLTSWELLIKTLSDKAMLKSKHALTNYIPR